MKKIFALLFLTPILAFSEDPIKSVWVAIPGYTLWDLYSNGGSQQDKIKRETKLVSSSNASWPDGRQALITYIEVSQENKKWLYRCVDFTDKSFQSTGQMCYELRSNAPEKGKGKEK